MVSSQTAGRPCPQCGTPCQTGHQYCPSCGFPVGNVSQSNEDRMIGRTLPGGYHVLDLVGVGGMGRVYRAEQSVLGRTVAVKVIHPHLLADESAAVRFLTEARAASQLNHPNSVSVYDFGRTEDGQPYLVMEFLRGKDLATVAWEEGPLPFKRVVDVLRQGLAALGEAHELGIVHRDLKPENIILEPLRRGGDFVKVVDFGLAKLKGDAQGRSVTNPGIVCGTPDYMSPEQGRGEELDGRSDLYAVGVILFQLLTGRLPFDADNPTQIVMMHLTIPVPDPRQVAPEREIPDELVDVLNRAMAKEADKRFRDAAEFSDALQAALVSLESVPSAGRMSAVPGSLAPSSLTSAGSLNCPSCGAAVPHAKFCLECGTKLPSKDRTEAPSAPPQLPLPLLARDEDLAWLEDRRQQVADSVLGARVVGEAGAGKTRLLREFALRARLDGDLVVIVGPDPFWCEAAFSTLRDAIRGLTGLSDGQIHTEGSQAGAETRRGLEEIFDSERSKSSDTRSAAERRHATADALRWALARAAKKTAPDRVILAVDELHRVDAPSRAAFADALGEPPQAGVLMLCTHVPGFESGWGAQHAARMLNGLPPPALSRLLHTVPAEHLQAAEDETGRGVLPLYAEQLLRFFIDGGNDPPRRLADLVAQRIDTLDAASRRTLQALAVIGDKVDVETVGELLSKSHPVQSTLEELDTAGMAAEDESLWSTSHPLLREIVLAGIPAAVRRDLHARAMRACEKRAAPIEAQALHAYEAQDAFQALLLLEQVSDRATQRGDLNTEIDGLRRGLEIARRDMSRGELDDPLRAVLIFARKLGAALTRAGNFADAEGILREALDIAGPSGSDRARVLGSLAHVAHGRHRKQEALGYIDQAIATAKESGAFDLVTSLNDTRRAWAS